MLVDKRASHISYIYAKNEAFFQLGYQIINKQKSDNFINCLKIKQDGNVKVMYSVENLVPVEEVIGNLSSNEVLFVLREVYSIINRIEEDGFFKKEAFDVSLDKIYLRRNKGEVVLILLPIESSYAMQDGLTWEKRLNETAQFMLSYMRNGNESIFVNLYSLFANNEATYAKVRDLLISNNSRTGSLFRYVQSPKKKSYFLEYDNFERIPLTKDDMIFGSSSKLCDVVIKHSKVISRMHFRIIKENDTWYISDLNSTNHTFYDGHMLVNGEMAALREGGVIKAANVTLVVRCG